jgi:F0F1-type ATP synthase assembly protein I
MADDHEHAPEQRSDDASTPTFGGRDLIGLGAFLVGAVVGGLLLGLFVDSQAGTSPTFSLIGIALGIALGAFGFWARVRQALRG